MDLRQLLSARSGHLREASILRGMTLKVNSFGDGINLGQGICDLEMPRELRLAAVESLFRDRATYTPYAGIRPLREIICERAWKRFGLEYGVDDVVVTIGATAAYIASLMAVIDPGDELVLFEPFYPYHYTGALLTGATVRTVPLAAETHAIDWDALGAVLGPATKVIVVNTPANPSGKVWTRSELARLETLLGRTAPRAIVITDEIYEDLVYDGKQHVPPASVGGLKDRSITISGLSKAFSITGWRLGWLAAPPDLAAAIGPVFDALCVCAARPLQAAANVALRTLDQGYFTELCAGYERRRGLLVDALRGGGFHITPPDGSYYVMADYRDIYGNLDPLEACYRLLDEVHIAGIPATIFYSGTPARWLRFQFAVEEPVIAEVARRLAARG